MKKNKLLCLAATIMALVICVTIKTHIHKNDTLFAMNLEALASDEYGSGTCGKQENACMFRCPNCNNLVYAVTEDLGPITSYNCSCGYSF